MTEGYKYADVAGERHRPHLRRPPHHYGGPPIDAVDQRTGDCPTCGTETELNMAGRVKSHGECRGVGELPLLDESLTPYWLTGKPKE